MGVVGVVGVVGGVGVVGVVGIVGVVGVHRRDLLAAADAVWIETLILIWCDCRNSGVFVSLSYCPAFDLCPNPDLPAGVCSPWSLQGGRVGAAANTAYQET